MTGGRPRGGAHPHRSDDATGEFDRRRPRSVTALAVALAIVALLAVGAGPVAADAGAATATVEGATVSDAAHATVSDADATAPSAADETAATQADRPLEGENGTTEVVVRFDPIDDPESLGEGDGDTAADDTDAAVADLREHAAAEQTAFEEFASSHPNVTIERELWLANAMVVTVDADAVAADELREVENVTRIHENVAVEPLAATESDRPQVDAEPSGRYTDGLRLIDAPTAWDRYDTRGDGATVAVVDTGVDPGHRDIDLSGWAAFDQNGTLVSDDVADANDPDGHGTHVAGTVAGGNASGTHIGVAPEADLYGIDAFEENGTATFAGVVAAMEYATVTAEADVLQMSLGANGTYGGFIGPVRNARATGTVVVAASGNEGPNTSSSPANVYDSLAVGAVDDDREVAEFSSGQPINATAAFGEYPEEWPESYVVPDVSAPGVRVPSAAAGTTDSYVLRQGTSMAAPHVSGIAALAVSATDGRATPDETESAIVDTAVHPEDATEPDDRYGHGVVDAPAAVGDAVEAAPPEPEPTDSNGTDDDSNDTDDEPNGTDDEPNGTDDDPNETDGGTDGQAPGFGVGVAVVSVASLLAVARVRRDRSRGDRQGP